jgi:nucleoside-diphosphate-sugar epimerase
MAVASHSEAAKGRVLVTGLHGFTGRYLSAELAQRGYEVHGTIAAAQHDTVSQDPRVHVADLLDTVALRHVVEQVRPTYVVHLAAIAFVGHGDAREIYLTNVVGTRNLLQALADTGPAHPKGVLLASSANIYGSAQADPIDEAQRPSPANDYAVSKLAMEHMAALWQDRLPISLVRPFNYTGVGQSESFLLPKIVAAFRSRAPVLELGNTDVERDFCDVRDVAAAYRGLLEAGAQGTFNICSGLAHSLFEVIGLAQEISGHSLIVRTNPAFVRVNEVHRLRGSAERLRLALGRWEPRPLRETLEWMLNQADPTERDT